MEEGRVRELKENVKNKGYRRKLLEGENLVALPLKIIQGILRMLVILIEY